MRSVLFEIPLSQTVSMGPMGAVPVFGVGLVLLGWLLLGAAWWFVQSRRAPEAPSDSSTWVVWAIVAGLIVAAPIKKSLPVYGFGSLLFLSYVGSSAFGAWRLRRQGLPGEIAWDVAIWIFVAGLLGGRLFYVIQYRATMFAGVKSLGEVVQKIVSLPEGGLVLYGGLLLAPVGYWLFCRRRGLAALPLADLLIPSVLIGLMFGRVGCLMHGCCYGDYSELPWSIEFPRDSAPYLTQVFRGCLPDDMSAPRSLPLHPTQIYDALNALAIALLCWLAYPYRRRDGEITAMAALLYPINRIAIEFLRWDEAGQFGTRFTISQWVSAGLIAVATLVLLRLSRLPPRLRPLVTPGYSSPT